MSWVVAGVAVVSGGIKMYQGHQQKKAGEEAQAEAEANKPEFEIPQEERANMLDAQKRALIGMDPAQRQAAEQDIQRTSQAAMRSSATRKGGLGMISQVAAQEGRSNLALMQADVQARRQNIQDMMRQRSVIAGYKQKRFEHQYNEYSSDLDYARAQIGAGIQNQQSGIDSMLGGVAGGFAGLQQAKKDVVDPTGGTETPSPFGGTDRNIFTGAKREEYNEYLDEMDDSDMVGDMSGVLSFKDYKQLQFQNNPDWTGNPEGTLSYDWTDGGGKRRIKRAMRNR